MGSKVKTIDLFDGYVPHAKQLAFHASNARIKCCAAGTRGGKTYAGAREFLRKVYTDRAEKRGRLFYWVVAPDYNLTEVAKEEIFDLLGGDLDDPSDSPLVKKWNASKLRLTLYGDIRVEFKSAERPERLVARGVNGVWIDEAGRCPAVTWSNLRARIADKQGWALFTTTPMGKNWFYNEIFELGLKGSPKRERDYASFHWTTADNTTLPHLRKEMEIARKTLPKRYFMRDWMASFEIFSGQIYDEFSRGDHVIERDNIPKDFTKVIMGKDWGFADNHPGASVVLGQARGGKWYLIEEIVETRRLLDWWVEQDKELVKKYGVEMIYADPSEPEHIYKYRTVDLPIMEARNRVAPGIQTVATLIHIDEDTGNPSLYFAEDCTFSIEEHENYRYKENRMGVSTEEPHKDKDHTCDAVRYALHSYLSVSEPEVYQEQVWGRG